MTTSLNISDTREVSNETKSRRTTRPKGPPMTDTPDVEGLKAKVAHLTDPTNHGSTITCTAGQMIGLLAAFKASQAEVERLSERLENNRMFNADGERVEVEPGTIPDGIECRDETIRQQDRQIAQLKIERDDAVEERRLGQSTFEANVRETCVAQKRAEAAEARVAELTAEVEKLNRQLDNATAQWSPRIAHLEALVSRLRDDTTFLLERLADLENAEMGEVFREFHGHVVPAAARLRQALQEGE